MSPDRHPCALHAPITPARRAYDHRLRVAIAESRDPHLFAAVDIPPSTRRSWLARPLPSVVALHPEDQELVHLQVALAQAQRANAKLRAVIRLLLALVAALGGRMTDTRVPSATHKARLLSAVRRSSSGGCWPSSPLHPEPRAARRAPPAPLRQRRNLVA